MAIEQVFPYGHSRHQPPQRVDLAAIASCDPAAMDDRALRAAVDGLEANQRELDAARLGVLGQYAHGGLHDQCRVNQRLRC